MGRSLDGDLRLTTHDPPPTSFCFKNELDLHRRVARERVRANCGAGVLAGLAEQLHEKLAGRVGDAGLIGEARVAVDERADAHRTVRQQAAAALGEEVARNMRILYGGSVKPENAKSLMSEEEIDGALVGGASLDPESFAAIVKY